MENDENGNIDVLDYPSAGRPEELIYQSFSRRRTSRGAPLEGVHRAVAR